MKKIIAIMLTLAMMLGTMTVSVFAAEELQNADLSQAGQLAEETGSDGQTGSDGIKITGFKTYSAYNSIALEWNKSKGAKKYEIYRNGKLIKTIKAANVKSAYDNEDKAYYLDKDVARSLKTYYDVKSYKYYIKVIGENGDTAKTETKTDSPVREMFITVTLKESVKLTSHDGKNKSHYFKNGQTLKTHGFGGGKYHFYYNGNLFFCSYLRTKNAKADYTKSFNYDRKEAEYFINSSPQKSAKKAPKKYTIWVSGYTQHLYLFEKKNGMWRLKKDTPNLTKDSKYMDWEVSTGKASTPSPVGFNKRIHQKIASRHGLGPWTSFQSMTSFHGAFPDWVKKLGTPQSGACIRNLYKQSRWIYNNVPIGAYVAVF